MSVFLYTVPNDQRTPRSPPTFLDLQYGIATCCKLLYDLVHKQPPKRPSGTAVLVQERAGGRQAHAARAPCVHHRRAKKRRTSHFRAGDPWIGPSFEMSNPLERMNTMISNFDITGQSTIFDPAQAYQPPHSAPSTPAGREKLTGQDLRKVKTAK